MERGNLRRAETGGEKRVQQSPPTDGAGIALLESHGGLRFRPSLLIEVENAMALSRELASSWLRAYMFAGDPEAQAKSEQVAAFFADHNNFRTHSRRIGLKEIRAKALPLKIMELEEDPALHRLVLRLHAAISHTFASTGTYRCHENSQAQGLFRMVQVVVERTQSPAPAPTPAPGGKKRKKWLCEHDGTRSGPRRALRVPYSVAWRSLLWINQNAPGPKSEGAPVVRRSIIPAASCAGVASQFIGMHSCASVTSHLLVFPAALSHFHLDSLAGSGDIMRSGKAGEDRVSVQECGGAG
jgi:hypothetical protein